MRYRTSGKRLFDLVLTIPALLVCAPLLALVALLVRVKLGAPILFRQQRAGRHGGPFTLVKFRTMSDARDAHGVLLPDAARLTPLGRRLRAASLDELPELWNVLKGDMSLVGPRPLLLAYLDRYTPEQARRHEVRPGLTGLAQIRGRGALPVSQRLSHDIAYVDSCSFWLDCKILFWTVYLLGSGQLHDGSGEDFSLVDDIGLSLGLSPETIRKGVYAETEVAAVGETARHEV